MRAALRVLVIILLGGFGGVLFERTIVPWLAAREPFSSIPRLTIERVTVVEPKEEVIVNEERALEKAVSAVRPMLVRVERHLDSGSVVGSASGVVLTSDGIVLTTHTITGGVGDLFVFRNGDRMLAKFVREDRATGLVLVRVSSPGGFSVPAFLPPSDVRLGASVFLLRAQWRNDRITPFLAHGIVIREVSTDESFRVTIPLTSEDEGAPLFAIDGKLAGLVASGGVVDSKAIEEFFNQE